MSDATALLINTRGNPDLLSATVLSLARLARWPNELKFCCRVDQDDLDTLASIARLRNYVNLSYVIGPRPMSLGAELNRFCHNVKAGFYHVINDDVIPLTPNWDEPQRKRRDERAAKGKSAALVACWMLPEIPGGGMSTPDYPIVTREWLDAAPGGNIFTEYFPFWFDDRWLQEVAMYVFGKGIGPLPIGLSARKQRTQRMRDIVFWFDFFIALADERISQAQSIADALGLGIDIRKDRAQQIRFMSALQARDRERVVETHGRFADKREPDPAYLAARGAAAQVLKAVAGREYDFTVKEPDGEVVDKAA